MIDKNCPIFSQCNHDGCNKDNIDSYNCPILEEIERGN